MGVNDHGDPSHVRRQGFTPGPLGWNDHALAQRRRLMVEAEYPLATRAITEIIARVDAASPDASLREKLKLCAAAVAAAAAATNLAGPGRVPGPIDHCMHAYFSAREQAFDGTLETAHAAVAREPADQEMKAPATGPRMRGEYFPPGGSRGDSEAPPSLGWQRVMRSTNDKLFLVESDPVRIWIDKGWADGLRDRSVNDDRLRSYPHTT